MSNFSKIIKANKYTMSSVISGDSILFDKTVSGNSFDMESVSVIANKLWTPAELGDNLVVWYDGTVTVDGNNHIVTAVDKSGNNNHGTVSGTGTLTIDAWNGYGTIIGTESGAGIQVPITGTDAYAFFMTADRMDDPKAVLLDVGITTSFVGAYEPFFRRPPTGGFSNIIFCANGAQVLSREALFNALDGGAVIRADWTSISGFKAFTIGNYPSDIWRFSGQWGDFLMLKERPNSVDRQKIEGYLAHRRGIQDKLPIDHPYRENPPVVIQSELPNTVTTYWSGNDLTEGLIDTWVDRVNGVVLTASGTERPTVATDVDGYKYAAFNGTSTRMFAALDSEQPNTILVYGSSLTMGRYYCDGGVSNGRNALFSRNDLSGFAGTQRSVSSSATAKHVFAGVFDNAGQSRLRGTSGVVNVSSMGTSNLVGFTLGDRFAPFGSDHHNGAIYAVVIMAGHAATPAEIEEIVAFLETQHGSEAT